MSVELLPVHNVERAAWQRGLGAILMREFVEDALLATPAYSVDRIAQVTQENIRNIQYNNVSVFWATAYAVAKIAAKESFDAVDSRVVHLFEDNPQLGQAIDSQMDRFTFWGSTQQVLREVQSTVAHFPISLARAVASFAVKEDSAPPAFVPRTFSELANMLQREDIRRMFDQSLLAANGFWQGFSTSMDGVPGSELPADPFILNGEDVGFSTEAIARMRLSMKEANDKQQVRKIAAVSTASSGCPARLRTVVIDTQDEPFIRTLAESLGKSEESLLAPRSESVALVGLDLIVKSLRAAQVPADEYIAQRHALTSRAVQEGQVSPRFINDIMYRP